MDHFFTKFVRVLPIVSQAGSEWGSGRGKIVFFRTPWVVGAIAGGYTCSLARLYKHIRAVTGKNVPQKVSGIIV